MSIPVTVAISVAKTVIDIGYGIAEYLARKSEEKQQIRSGRQRMSEVIRKASNEAGKKPK